MNLRGTMMLSDELRDGRKVRHESNGGCVGVNGVVLGMGRV